MRAACLMTMVAAALTACTMQPISPQKAAQYKTVGLLSAMGDDFQEAVVGFTVFGNEHRSEPLAVNVDATMTEKVTQALSRRYTVVDLGRYRKSFMAAPKHWPGGERLFGKDSPPVGDVVRQIMGEEHLDAYVLVTPGSCAVRGTNQGTGGVGVLKLRGRPLLHAAYVVSVIDGQDFSVVADMRAVPVGEGFLADPFGGSTLNCPNTPATADYLDNAAGNLEFIRQTFTRLMDQSLPQTLRAAKLAE